MTKTYGKLMLLKLFLFLSLCNLSLNANNLVLDDFFNLGGMRHEQSTLELSNSKLEYIDKVRVDGSYKRAIDNTSQQNVAVRVYPKNFKAYNLEKKHFTTKQAYVNASLDKENLLIQERNYILLVQAKFQNKLLNFLKETIVLYKHELKAKKALLQGKFYVEAIFFVNRKLELLKLKALKQRRLYMSSVHAIHTALSQRYSLLEIQNAIESYTLDSSSKLLSKMKNCNFMALRDNSIEKQLDEQEEQVIQENIKLESIKEKFSFDFFELGYNNKETQGNSMSFGVGVDLPLKKSNQIRIMEEKLALVELGEKSRIEDEVYLRDAKLLLEEAQTLYAYEQGLQELLVNDDFYQLYSKKEDADQRFILEIQERDLKAKEELLEIEERLHQTYIKLLVLTHGFNNSVLSPLIVREF